MFGKITIKKKIQIRKPFEERAPAEQEMSRILREWLEPFEYVKELDSNEKEVIKASPLCQQLGDYCTAFKYKVVKPLVAQVTAGEESKVVSVPVGFLTDGCSGPGLCANFVIRVNQQF